MNKKERKQLDEILEYAAGRGVIIPADILLDIGKKETQELIDAIRIKLTIKPSDLPLFNLQNPGAVPPPKKEGLVLMSTGWEWRNFAYNKFGMVTRGVTIHKNLTQLDYASAGHTGFQPAGAYLLAETDPIFSASEAAMFAAGDAAKLAGIEAGAEVNNISDINAVDLTDGGATNLHTHVGIFGNGAMQYQTIITGAIPFAPVYSDFLLSGTAGGKTVFAVTNTKTLTLTAIDDFNLTVPATGTAALLNQANSFTLINPITTIAESWIGPTSLTGIYFKGGNVGIGTTNPLGLLHVGTASSRIGFSVPFTPAADHVTAGDGTTVASGHRFIFNYGYQYVGTSAAGGFGATTVTATNSSRAQFGLSRARGTGSTPAAVALDDYLGSFSANGFDGTSYIQPVEIDFYVDGAVSTGTVPGRISFSTGGSVGTRVERLMVKNTGEVHIGDTSLGAGVTYQNLNVGGSLLFAFADSTQESPLFQIVPSYVVNTHASYTSKTIFSQWAIGGAQQCLTLQSGVSAMIGFYGGAPVVRGAALTAQLTTITYTAPGSPDYAFQDVTNTLPYGFTDAEELRTFISVVKNLQDRVAQLEARLGSATGVNLFI